MEKKWVRVVFRRRIFIIALIAVQIAFILFVLASSNYLIRDLTYFLRGLSIVVCIYILNKHEKTAYKLTWIFLILVFPIFGGSVYIFFHSQATPRKLKRQMDEINRRLKPFFTPAGDALADLAAEYSECLPQANYLQNYAGFPVYNHTETKYFDSGESFYAQAMEEMEKAEKYIFLEFFILRQGKMLDPIIDLLERKAKQGLDIRLIYDGLGCFMTLPPNFNETLEQKGNKVCRL